MFAPLTQQLIQWLMVAIAALGISTSAAMNIKTRPDLHVELKHGISARTLIQTQGYQEAYYSATRKSALLLYCVTPNWCAGMVLNAKGVKDPNAAYLASGRLLEKTSFFAFRTYWNMVIIRDFYIRVY